MHAAHPWSSCSPLLTLRVIVGIPTENRIKSGWKQALQGLTSSLWWAMVVVAHRLFAPLSALRDQLQNHPVLSATTGAGSLAHLVFSPEAIHADFPEAHMYGSLDGYDGGYSDCSRNFVAVFGTAE
jgi:hypothetical protein